MNRIYQNKSFAVGGDTDLDQAASQHILQVLRLRVGDTIVLFNGDGSEYHAKLTGKTKQCAQVRISDVTSINREPSLAVHLGQCLSRGERMDYAIQKSVEVGVHEITPLFASRCNVKIIDERLDKRLMHWRHIIISACEQSGRTRIPILNPPMVLRDWILQCKGFSVVADFQQTNFMLDSSISRVNLLIGPEGGLTPEEIQLAHQHQFKSFSLGALTLRTETASIVAITQLQLLHRH